MNSGMEKAGFPAHLSDVTINENSAIDLKGFFQFL
jgi:hypothetical protein